MHKISKHSIETRIVPKKDAKEVMMDFKKIYTAHNLSNVKSEYENFKEKYKDNKKLMKKVKYILMICIMLYDWYMDKLTLLLTLSILVCKFFYINNIIFTEVI